MPTTFLIRQVLEADPDSDEPPGTASLGWIALPIFADPDRLNGGFWRLPLFHPPINVGKTKEARHVDGCCCGRVRATWTAVVVIAGAPRGRRHGAVRASRAHGGHGEELRVGGGAREDGAAVQARSRQFMRDISAIQG